jgi:molybdopterin/thiamine biosynthesis adenylyltransferase
MTPDLDPRAHFAHEPAIDLKHACVAVVGCGSVGGLAAWDLAGAGVRRLILIDRDRLEADNLRRHVCGRGDLGRPKAHAVGGFLAERFAKILIEAHDLCVLESPDETRQLLSECDATLIAVDAEGPKHLIDGMTRMLRRPVVYTGVYGFGWAGEAILSDPTADTPCYACAARALGRVGSPVEPVQTPAYAQPVDDRPRSDWPRADLASIAPVAALAARLVVALLASRNGFTHMHEELTTGHTSAWRLALRSVPGWGGPWQMLPVVVGRIDECPVCGTTAVEGDLDALLAGSAQP